MLGAAGNPPKVQIDKPRLEKVIRASNGCEWAVRMQAPPIVVKGLRDLQQCVIPAEAQKVRAFRERLLQQDTNWLKNCGGHENINSD